MNRLSIQGYYDNHKTELVLTVAIQSFTAKINHDRLELTVVVPCLEPALFDCTAWRCDNNLKLVTITPTIDHNFNEDNAVDKLYFTLEMNVITHVSYDTK